MRRAALAVASPAATASTTTALAVKRAPERSRRSILHVQRSGDMASPRASGSTSAFGSSSKPGSVSVNDLRSPPGRRTRQGAGGGASSSFGPRPIVLAAMRVIRETAAMPPCPAALVSDTAKSRRCRSPSSGNIAALRSRSFCEESSSIIPNATTHRQRGESPPPRFHAKTDSAVVRRARRYPRSERGHRRFESSHSDHSPSPTPWRFKCVLRMSSDRRRAHGRPRRTGAHAAPFNAGR